MRKHIFASGLLLAICIVSYGQETGPEAPDIMLPPMILEIEDVSEENIQAVLPEVWDPLIPEMAVSLPQPEAISVAPDLVSVELIGEEAFTGEAQASGASTFLSEGMIGAGASNHILGDITLYKFGPSPRFSIHFYHEGMDGYGKHDAGEGFFFSDNAIDGNLSYTSEKLALDFTAGYSETEDGLQEQSTAYSVKHRLFSGTAEAGFDPREHLSLKGAFSFQSLNKLLTGSNPQEDTETVVHPSLEAGLTFPTFGMTLSAGYTFRTVGIESSPKEDEDDNWLRSELAFHWAVSSLDIGGRAGIAWDFGDAFFAPFSVDISGAVRDILSFSLSGGFGFEEQRYSDILDDNPFIAIDGLLRPSYGYFGTVELRGNVKKDFSLYGGGDLRFLTSTLVPDYDSMTNGMYSLANDERTLLAFHAGVSFSLLRGFTLQTGWKGQFLDLIDSEEARHTLDARAEYSGNEGKYGGTLSFSFPFAVEPELPYVGLEGFFRISEGVSILLKGEDLLSPLLEKRLRFGEYEDEGMSLSCMLKISL